MRDNGSGGIPAWVWIVMLVLAASQPLLFVWISHGPPHGTEPTGLHIADSALFLQSMRMFTHDFASPYATCQSHYGLHGPVYFGMPHLWFYGMLGLIARALRVSNFMFCGIANGVGAFCYLLAAYCFLREVARKQANLAFLLFALSGGLGGVLYLVTGLLGYHHSPEFELLFKRYAVYELFEGPHLLPVLLFPRSYYTFSLALCFGALTAFIRGCRTGSRAHFLNAWLMLLPGMFIDPRYGVFTFGIAFLFVTSQRQFSINDRVRLVATFALYCVLGGAPAALLMRVNPAIVENHFRVANMAMWLSPFVSVALFHLLLVPGEIRRRLHGFAFGTRAAVFALSGYLAAFALLFCGYQGYFGNVWVARDAAVAAAISDWAVVGLLAGWSFALLRRVEQPSDAEHDWVVVWLLLYLALAISAFGQGWFLRYGPQRIEVFLWLPLCILSASALQRFREREPRTTAMLTGIMVGCGVCSIGVSVLCFQGPLGYRPHASPYASYHVEVMSQADADTMARAGAGIVVAPIPASDIFALKRGNRTVFGTGSFNLSDQPYVVLETEVDRFFSEQASEDFRKDFVEHWCVEYIYCPDTWPVPPEVVEQLRECDWLDEIASEGNAVLFQVLGEPVVLASSG